MVVAKGLRISLLIVSGLTHKSYLLAVDALVKYHPNAPDIDAVVNFGRAVVGSRETFGREVPVSSSALRRQFDAFVALLAVVNLGQAKVRDFNVAADGTICQQNIS